MIWDEDTTTGRVRQIGPESLTLDEVLPPYYGPQVDYIIDGKTLTISERTDDGSPAELSLRFERGGLGLSHVESADCQCMASEVPKDYTENAVHVPGASEFNSDPPTDEDSIKLIATRNELLTAAIEAFQGRRGAVLLESSYSSV